MSKLFCVLLLALVPVAAQAKAAEVFVLGALHALHEQEPAFGYADLEEVIDAIKPDVILLEVTPEELAGRVETKGRPEYPKVIWPMLGTTGVTFIAMEAAQPLYGELTGDASRRWATLAAERPEDKSALDAHTAATRALLLRHWKNVADTQDAATDAIARARTLVNAAFVPGLEPAQTRWDKVMVDVVTRAIAEHPGKRLLVLGSHSNRYMFIDALGRFPNARLVDMEAWLRANGFGD